ncbi:BatD family protein [Rhodohalobacter sp. 8-1]|uniref:BatD family protein n=1 Tax=Rhodohalobacter sp. 8-1 TaxID=3131972 RepID=UPI0030EC04F8
MIKIGNYLNGPTLFLFLMLALSALHPTRAQAQDVSLDAVLSETKIFTGEQFTLSIEVQSSGTHSTQLPQLPVINGAHVISSNPSRSTSISIVNGQTSRTTSYIYTLIATSIGTYTLPAIEVVVDGEIRRTDPISFEVIEKGNLSDTGPQMPDIFVQVEVDDKEPVPGQQIVADIVLYFKQGIEVTSFQPSFGWSTDGFWKEDLENASQPRAESTILSGVRYRKATLLRYALFPSRSGSLTLNEYGLTVGMRTQTSRNDPFGSFFGSGTNQRRVELTSEPVELTVRPLPERDESSVNINAVGDIQVERTVNKTRIEAGETFELETRISGEGNIPLIRRPEFTIPEEIETFTPNETNSIERVGLTIRGEKIYTQQLVTRTPGSLTIPSAKVAVFDPATGRYRYRTLPAIELEVTPAPATVSSADTPANVLQPVTGLASWQAVQSPAVYQRAWFWIFLLIPVLALIIGRWRKYYIDRLMGDNKFRRSEFAEKIASERLELAKSKLADGEDTKELYSQIHKAVSGYVSDKLGLPEAGLSDNEIIENVEQQSVNGQTLKSTKYILDKCNTISFAPTAGKDDIESDIQKAEELITSLKKAL